MIKRFSLHIVHFLINSYLYILVSDSLIISKILTTNKVTNKINEKEKIILSLQPKNMEWCSSG